MVADGFDIFEKIVVLQLFNPFVIIIQLVAVAEDDRILPIAEFSMNINYLILIFCI